MNAKEHILEQLYNRKNELLAAAQNNTLTLQTRYECEKQAEGISFAINVVENELKGMK